MDAVLAEFGVIPLNSPRYYPRYNGAIEYGQRELKAWFTKLASWRLPLQTVVTTAQTWINLRVCRCLDGNNAQEVFLQGNRVFPAEYTMERRKEIKSWIEDCTQTIVINMRDGSQHAYDAAWRQAVEVWLLEHGFLEVLQPKKCYPIFEANGLK